MADGIIENGPLTVAPSVPLWRYVGLPALLLYLDGKLRLPSVSGLRRMDVMEGVPAWDEVTQSDAFKDSEYAELYEYVKSTLSDVGQKSLVSNVSHPPANQQVIYEHWRDLVASTRYALCLFQAKHESMAMWRLYAPRGFAIRTSVAALQKALSSSSQSWCISRMKYWSREEEITPDRTHSDQELMALLRRPFLIKGKEYESENEARLVTVAPSGRPTLVVDGIVPQNWIEEIRISPEMWSEDGQFLRELVEKRCPQLAGIITVSPVTNAQDSTELWLDEEEAQYNEKHAKSAWPKWLWEP